MRKFFCHSRKNRITENSFWKQKWETSTRTLFRQPLTIWKAASGRRRWIFWISAMYSGLCFITIAGQRWKNWEKRKRLRKCFVLQIKRIRLTASPTAWKTSMFLKWQWKISLNARKLTIILETFGMTNASIKKQRKTGKWQPNWIHSIRLYSETLLLFITINQMNRRRPVRYWKRRLALTHQMPEFSLNLISYTKNLVCQQRTGLLFMRNMQIRLWNGTMCLLSILLWKTLWVSMKKHMNCLWEENSIRGKAEKEKQPLSIRQLL